MRAVEKRCTENNITFGVLQIWSERRHYRSTAKMQERNRSILAQRLQPLICCSKQIDILAGLQRQRQERYVRISIRLKSTTTKCAWDRHSGCATVRESARFRCGFDERSVVRADLYMRVVFWRLRPLLYCHALYVSLGLVIVASQNQQNTQAMEKGMIRRLCMRP